jgi:hypothetical protein
LLSTSISISQKEGRVWVGPGVEKTAAGDDGGVAAAEVTAMVGFGVPVLFAGCVHPAARTSTTQSTSAKVITSIFFISDNYLNGILLLCRLSVEFDSSYSRNGNQGLLILVV